MLPAKPEEMTFTKAVAQANEIECAYRAAKITKKDSREGATSATVLKMNPARSKGEKSLVQKGSVCVVANQTTHLRNAGSAGLSAIIAIRLDTWCLYA